MKGTVYCGGANADGGHYGCEVSYVTLLLSGNRRYG